MLSRYRILTCAFIVSVAFVACTGEDGEPGPQGEEGTPGTDAAYKAGFFEGSVSGTRKDGIPFSEFFWYEYIDDNTQIFHEKDGQKFLSIERSLTPVANDPYFYMDLKEVQGGLAPAALADAVTFSFEKEIDNNSLFVINATPYFGSTTGYAVELSAEQNEIYKFEGNATSIFYETTVAQGQGTRRFIAHPNENEAYDVYYKTNGGELAFIFNRLVPGPRIDSGPLFDLYNKLQLGFNETYHKDLFYDAVTNEPLYTAVPTIVGDQLTIANYKRDETTGVVSFNFELKISGDLSVPQRKNSTGHDLTITGKFYSGEKVYKNIIARERN